MATGTVRRPVVAKRTVVKRKRGLNLDRAREKQKELEDRSDSPFHELKEGWNFLYIMPPWREDVDVLWKEVQQHQRLVCPKAASGKPCALCDEIRRRLKKGDSEFADEWRLRARAFFNAIRKEHIKLADKANVKVLGVPPTVFEAVLEHITDEEVDISDPHAAVLVAIRRKGKGLRTRYPKVKFAEPIDISRYITEEVLEGMWDLDALRATQPATVKDLRKAIRGGADADDDADDDDLGKDEDEFSDDDLDSSDEESTDAEAGDLEDELLEEPADPEDLAAREDELDELMGDDDDEPEPAPRVKPRPSAVPPKRRVSVPPKRR